MKATRSGGVDMLWWRCMTWHGCICCWVGRNVFMTCAAWVCQREQAAGAGKQEIQQYERGRTPWEFTETLWNMVKWCSKTEDLCEQLFDVVRTYRRAPSTDIRQELSWASWCEVGAISTLRCSYGTGMRCWSAYLGWRELTAAAGQDGLEGQIGEINRWSKLANTAGGKAISSRNPLSEYAWWLYVQLPEDLQCGAISGGGSVLRDSKQIYFFRSVEQFSEKLEKGLYSMATDYRRL